MGIFSTSPSSRHTAGGFLSLMVFTALVGCDIKSSSTARSARSAIGSEGGINYTSLDLGTAHGCVVRSDGQVFCWGSNSWGQSAPGSSTSTITNLGSGAVISLSGGTLTAAEVSLGGNLSCARRTTGSIVCWGDDTLGIVTGTTSTTPAQPTETTVTIGGVARAARSIATGGNHLCAALDDGTVACRGSNARKELGVSSGTSSTTFVTVQTVANGPLTNAVKVVAGNAHACALLADGQVFCWGDYPGTGTAGVLATSLLSNAIDLVGGDTHTCALLVNRSIRCWGANGSGQLGNGSTTASSIPVAVQNVPTGEYPVSIGAGANHTCAIFTNNRTYCWGSNGNGQAGLSMSTAYATTPTNPVNLGAGAMNGALAVTGGTAFTCVTALNSSYNDGAVRCWGTANSGQLGTGTGADTNTPVTSFPPDYACGFFFLWSSQHGGPLIDSGDDHVCAFMEVASCANATWARGVTCWGANGHGQLGRGSTSTSSSTPMMVSGLTADIISLSSGGGHTCVVTVRGEVFCWGNNASGQCGQTVGGNVTTPTLVTLDDKAVQVTAGADFTCALMGNGQVECWGNNALGTLGRVAIEPNSTLASNALDPSSTPQRVLCGVCTNQTLDSVAQISAGANSVCARLANGQLRCWGHNPIASGSRRTVSGEATRIFGCGRDWRFCGCGVTNDWCSPYAEKSQSRNSLNILPHAGAPDANFDPTAAPPTCEARPTLSDFLALSVSAHNDGACLVRPDSRVRCWGVATNGRLGDGTTSAIAVPSFVGSDDSASVDALGHLTNVMAVSGRNATRCAVRGDGTVQCWGASANSQAGDTTDRTLGHIIRLTTSDPLSNVIGVSAGLNQSCAMTAGSVRCWGNNALGALGRSYPSSSTSALQVTF